MFSRDVLLQQKPTAVPYSALMGFSFGYRSGRDVIRVYENDHIPPGSGAIADWQRPSRSLSPYRAFFYCLRHVVMRRNAQAFLTFETDSKSCARGQIRIVIS
jgi:hypothetical protein